MLYPAIGKLVEKTGNRYRLVILTAKRAREIFEDELKNKTVYEKKPVPSAVDEIADGKIGYTDQKEKVKD